jgi:parallel beta-helix repeat protein
MIHARSQLSILLILPSLAALSAAGESGLVGAWQFASQASFTGGIQEAIDSLPRDGGVVQLPPGTYPLRRSVQLRSRVVLRGSGAATVLQRGPQVRSLLSRAARPGDKSVAVESAAGFEVGTEVAVMDSQQGGWYVAHRTIVRVEGNVLHLDRPLERDYDPKRQAVVINCFPGILVDRQESVSIEDLCLDGRLEANPGPNSDFTLAAIHLVAARDCTVRHCRVTGWPSDGIGVQGGSGNRVVDCTVESCRGHGLHPGTSVQSSVFSRNVARRNAWDGLYFCMECRYVVVSDSVFEANGTNGIGGLGDGGDCFNVVQGNVCVGNRQCGILAVNGANNSIVGNICLNNSASQARAFAGIRLLNASDMTVTGNRCLDERDTKTQAIGIEECGTSDRNLVTGNHCRGNLQAGVRLTGKNSSGTGNME